MKITMPTGEMIEINGRLVVRVFPATPMADPVGSVTRIEWADTNFCIESPEAVVAMVNEERAGNTKPQLPLSQLMLPGGKPFWFSGEQATGPVHLPDGFVGDGVKSKITMPGFELNVGSMPEEVLVVIKAAGGTPLPIRGPTTYRLIVDRLKALFQIGS